MTRADTQRGEGVSPSRSSASGSRRKREGGTPSPRLALFAALLALAISNIARAQTIYEKDIAFALAELPKHCGDFFQQKKIDWPAVTKQFADESAKVTTDEEHLKLLIRLVARLKDGHAAVQPLAKGKSVPYPNAFKDRTGPGMFWCVIGGKVYVKNSSKPATAKGVTAGSEVVTVEGMPAREWLQQRVDWWSDTVGFSTDQMALAWTCHWGLVAPPTYQLHMDLRRPYGKQVGAVMTYTRGNFVPDGPAFFPPDLQGDRDVQYAKLTSGHGYIHIRRCPGNLPEAIDKPLAELGNVKGMILDFRANGGGGFDHEALMGRFIPNGKTMAFVKRYASAGPNPYGGPVVVIVDGNCRSAGETASGMIKEDGRGYMIGETATAGMSSSKETIELPSGLFALYVSVHSNMARFNNGRGIEGVGVPPNEIVEYDPTDLANGRDTLTIRAQKLLDHFPQDKVKYDPKDFGWSATQRD